MRQHRPVRWLLGKSCPWPWAPSRTRGHQPAGPGVALGWVPVVCLSNNKITIVKRPNGRSAAWFTQGMFKCTDIFTIPPICVGRRKTSVGQRRMGETHPSSVSHRQPTMSGPVCSDCVSQGECVTVLPSQIESAFRIF